MGISASTFLFAIVAFASTTADDLVVLITFQSLNVQNKQQTHEEMMHNMYLIAIGQIISYSIIVCLSLTGLLLGNFLDEEYVSLIGFIPLFLGVKGLYDHFCGDDEDEDEDVEMKNIKNVEYNALHNENVDSDEVTIELSPIKAPVEPIAKAKLDNDSDANDDSTTLLVKDTPSSSVTKVQLDIENSGVDDGETDLEEQTDEDTSTEGEDDDDEESNALSRSCDKLFHKIMLNPLVAKVAIAGLVVGSDNIAVYISLFAKLKYLDIVVAVLIIFYLLLAFYIFLAYVLVTRVEHISVLIDKYASIGIPILLIALGLFILHESVVYFWLIEFL